MHKHEEWSGMTLVTSVSGLLIGRDLHSIRKQRDRRRVLSVHKFKQAGDVYNNSDWSGSVDSFSMTAAPRVVH